jgi:hypothetical protein
MGVQTFPGTRYPECSSHGKYLFHHCRLMPVWNRCSGWPSAVATAVLAMASVLWLAGDWAGPTIASGARGPNRCPNLQSRDYAAPMRDFPPVRSVPQKGQFPFGPPNTALPSLTGPMQPGGGELGFSVDLFRNPPLQRRLDWQVRLRVSRLSARGIEREVVAERRISPDYSQEVGHEDASLATTVPGRPGFYRLDISIKNSLGLTLGSYSEYVRVVAPTVNVRLVLGGERFQSGDVVRGRIQNRGTVAFSYMPSELQLERLQQSGWRVAAEAPAWRGPVAMSALLPGGAKGSCYGMRLPDGLDPGTYRVSQPISAHPRSLTLRAVFRVG